jgi:Tol biopolymer transport system component
VTRALPGHNFRKDAGLIAAWAPDGSQFIVPGKVGGNWELFLYNKGEHTGKPITDLAQYRVEVTEDERIQLNIGPSMQLSFSELKYSPSGKRVIFTLSRLAKTAVWWHDLQTGVSRQATEDRTGYDAALHPGDDIFYYTCMVRKNDGISADEDIIQRSISSGVADTMLSTRDHEHYPDVSPDGKYLLYIKGAEGINNVHAMNLESKETKQLTSAHSGQNCNIARWSSDGKMIFVQGAGFLSKPAVFMLKFEPF